MTKKHVKRSAGIKAAHYKCFGEGAVGFEEILPINLIVGRNNSGKSALLDLAELACNFQEISPAHKPGEKPSVLHYSTLLEEADWGGILGPPAEQAGSPSGVIIYNNASQHRRQLESARWQKALSYVGKRANFTLGNNNTLAFSGLEGVELQNGFEDYFKQMPAPRLNPFHGKKFRRLMADRDIVPEPDNNQLSLDGNGRGFTNVIHRLLHDAREPHTLVDHVLLDAFNKVFQPDAKFTGIVPRENGGRWEIYLKEDKKGLVPLSHSGSGLKTVLLVIGYMELLPYIEKKGLGDFVFAFEELENNLHPALQRRLVSYVREKSLASGCTIFLTTHSSAVIDMLSKDGDAQIIHVSHNGQSASARRVATYLDNRGVLDDLDVRASDLLQSNCLVWVEGPSDRLYFNKWISLLTGGKLVEGSHYQCVFYGGRLLAHLSGEEPFGAGSEKEAVQIFGVNRNAILIIDSDKKSAGATINATKMLMVEQVEKMDGIAWITKGKEIENYISGRILNELLSVTPPATYSDFADHLEKQKKGAGVKFTRKKVQFAESAAEIASVEDLEVLDLRNRLEIAANYIARSNGARLEEMPVL